MGDWEYEIDTATHWQPHHAALRHGGILRQARRQRHHQHQRPAFRVPQQHRARLRRAQRAVEQSGCGDLDRPRRANGELQGLGLGLPGWAGIYCGDRKGNASRRRGSARNHPGTRLHGQAGGKRTRRNAPGIGRGAAAGGLAGQ